MEDTKERKVISRKQMSTKLLDAFFIWSIVFGIAAMIVEILITMPISLVFRGVFLNILTTIIGLVICAFQWMFTARIAVKLTFNRYTINKSENIGILNKTMVVFSIMYIGACILNLVFKGSALGLALDISVFGSVGFLMLLDIITAIAAIAILKYVLNSQEGYIYKQCVEGQPEEKVGMSIEEKVLLGIIVLIIIYIVCIVISSKNVFLFDSSNDNDKQIEQEVTITEEGKKKAKVIAQNVHAKNLYKQVEGKYEKATAEELQMLINEELKNELGKQYFVVVTEDLEIHYSFEEKIEIEETKEIKDKYSPEVAEAKSIVALVFAENLYKEQNGQYIKTNVKELEKLINDELLKELGTNYTVTLSEDYEVTYNFEVE